MYAEGTGSFNLTESYSKFLYIRISGDVHITIPDDKKSMNCTISNLKNNSSYYKVGDGFYNVYSIGVYKDFDWTTHYDDWSGESVSRAFANMVTAYPNYYAETIWGVCIDDSDGSATEIGNKNGTWTIALSDDDFNPDGSLTNFEIMQAAKRNAFGSEYGVECSTTKNFSISANAINWSYYPFAVRQSDSWQSCNRTDGYVKVRQSSSWVDVLNMQANDVDDAFYRSGSSWVRCPKIGENA